MIRRTALFIILVVLIVSPILAAETPSQNRIWQNPKDGMKFMWIPPGSLLAEIPNDSTEAANPTQEKIHFPKGFWMGRTEVTVKQFRRFIRETGYSTDAEKAGNRFNWKNPGFEQKDNHPVVYLSFEDALRYTEWAGVDLPTEAEWYYAARAGADTRFYWGDQLDDRYVWHRGNSEMGSHPAATRHPNAWGLYDMVGNAWEYCKICDDAHIELGASWTRCPEYKTRQGFVARMIQDVLKPRLSPCKPPLAYPWDDDRGFRCIYRSDEN